MKREKDHGQTDHLRVRKKRLFITVIFLVLSLTLTLYCHFILGIGVVFTHFFYIPIVLSSIWWGYSGVLVALGLGIMLFVSHTCAGGYSYADDLFRIFFFIAVSYLTGFMGNSEKAARCRLFESEEILRIRKNVASLLFHQLLSPLSSVKWILAALLDGDFGKVTKKQRDVLAQTGGLTKKGINTIKDFLCFNKIEAGEIKYCPVPTDLTFLIEQLIADQEDIIKKKKLKISFKETGLAKIKIDPEIARQIIRSLLANAVQYAPSAGEIKISVEVLNKEILIEISDNGCGIPRDEQKKVFQQFFRGSNIVQNAPQGAGTALSLVKSLVELCQGRIWFKSKEDTGTTFYFTLPIQK